MAIDLKEVKALWDKQERGRPPQVIYKTVELSTAWENMLGWVTEYVTKLEKEKLDIINTYERLGDYTAESLLKQKALLDITHGQLRIMLEVKGKLQSYHSEKGEN